MTAILDPTTDPLAPGVLPTSARSLEISTDVPSDARPFGLTHTVQLGDDEAMVDLSGLHYDPVRQVNVTPEGTPVIDLPNGPVAAVTTYDTKYDNQWFTDKDWT
ncbi:MAG TPA: putative ATP-grasp-modified RiPP [Pseudonocardiaceae bacterium]